MIAILLSAGLGSRLKPITNKVPKCLVPVNGKSLIDYWFEQLSNAGIERFLVNTHYMANKVERHIRKSEFAHKVKISFEEELLLTAGTIARNEDFINNQAFMLVHADNLSICNFSSFIESHIRRPKGTEITMMTFITDDPKNSGIVELDSKNIVQNFHEKSLNPPSNLANAAVYIVEPTVINFIKSFDKNQVDFSTDILPNYLGKINTFFNDSYHRDIGTLLSYGLAQVELIEFLNEELN